MISDLPSRPPPFVPSMAPRPSAGGGPHARVPPDPALEEAPGADAADFGPLAPFVAADDVTDILVNGSSGLWVCRAEGMRRIEDWSADERAVRGLAVKLIALGGRHVDEASPCVDVRVHRGIRIHAVLPPVSASGTLLSIRIPRSTQLGLTDLVAAGALTEQQREFLMTAVGERQNLLVTGAAGSGKTTLLAALLAEASPDERIIAVEDVTELFVRHPHVVSLETRQANLEGVGAIDLERLVREALRMRPDRLVVGECRGREIRELLAAFNTGHDGGAGTVHANSLADVPARLEALGSLAGMDPQAIARQAFSAIGLVLHLEFRGGRRRLAEIGRFVVGLHGRLEIHALAA